MRQAIAFWNILLKDMRAYYLKPPNVSWGILFPLAWTAMFFIKSGSGPERWREVLPGVAAISILFGTTSMLAVTVTFKKKGRSFERLLLAPISLELLMFAKTAGAILFAANTGVVSGLDTTLALVCGLVLASGVHATKAAARPVVNGATMGIGAPFVSLAEDVLAVIGSLLAVFFPLLFVLFAAALGYLAYRLIRQARRLRAPRASRAPSSPAAP